MSKLGFGTYALMVTIILWGVLLGGVVYSHMVFFPVFLSNLPESSAVVKGVYGLDESRFWMTLHPLLIISLIISLISNWRDAARRRLIAMTFGVYTTALIVTMWYFVPQLMAFASSAQEVFPESYWDERASLWITLSTIRGLILFIFILPLLIALARPRGVDAAG